jgi:tRNA threonylcarbamoyladenosine biosynthesis protein TsaB
VRILGLDTATRKTSVGLAIDETIVASRVRTTGTHAVSLLPLIEEVLGDAGWSVSGLDACAISAGPGSFTGLRVGFSVAKGLAHAIGVPLVTVPTLEALARTVHDYSGTICALLDARKGELYQACFRRQGESLERVSADAVTTPEALVCSLPGPCLVVGDAVPRYGEFLRERLARQVTLVSWETHAPCGGVVASMGHAALQTGHPGDPAALEPHYIRASEAQVRFA